MSNVTDCWPNVTSEGIFWLRLKNNEGIWLESICKASISFTDDPRRAMQLLSDEDATSMVNQVRQDFGFCLELEPQEVKSEKQC